MKPIGLAFFLKGMLQGNPYFLSEHDIRRVMAEWAAARSSRKPAIIQGVTTDHVLFAFWSEDVIGLSTLTEGHFQQQPQGQQFVQRRFGPGTSGVN